MSVKYFQYVSCLGNLGKKFQYVMLISHVLLEFERLGMLDLSSW